MKAIDINTLSVILRSRIKQEIIEPLMVLEEMPKEKHNSTELIQKVFEDFKEINDRIWEEMRQKVAAVEIGAGKQNSDKKE